MADSTSPNRQRAEQLDAVLDKFVMRLREDGYALTYEALSAATGIFLEEAYRNPKDLSRLKYRLTPLFATNESQQEHLYLRIDELACEIPPRTSFERGLESQADAKAGRRLAILLTLCGAVIAAIVVFTQIHTPEAPIPTPPPIRQVEAAPIVPAMQDAPEIPEVPDVEVLPQTVLVTYREDPHPSNRYVIAAAIFAPVSVALFWALFRFVRRRRWRQVASYEPDAPAVVSAMLAQRGLPMDNTLDAAGRKMARAHGGFAGEMDMRATVVATARSAGFLTVVEDRRGEAADYVVLIEKRSEGDHLARIAELMLDRVEAAGVTVKRFTYRDDPRFSMPAEGGRKSTSFGDLVSQFGRHRFLVVGAAEGFFNPITGQFVDWPQAERVLLSRSLLSSRRHAAWGYQEAELVRQGFLIAEASPAGLASYGAVVSGGGRVSGKSSPAYTAKRSRLPDAIGETPLDRYHQEVAVSKRLHLQKRAELAALVRSFANRSILAYVQELIFSSFLVAAYWLLWRLYSPLAHFRDGLREALSTPRQTAGAAVRSIGKNLGVLAPAVLVSALGFVLAAIVAEQLVDRSLREITERIEEHPIASPEEGSDRILSENLGPVLSAAFSLDGRWIVTASEDRTARIWGATIGAELRRLEGHGDRLRSAAFSRDGRWIVTGSDDGTARVWDAASGAERLRLEGHGGVVWSAAFSPDGRWIVTGSGDDTARVWDAATGTELRRLE
ncbi:MAG: hypothetical protein AAGC57_20015, partial [Pseudomonadota bacterium]